MEGLHGQVVEADAGEQTAIVALSIEAEITCSIQYKKLQRNYITLHVHVHYNYKQLRRSTLHDHNYTWVYNICKLNCTSSSVSTTTLYCDTCTLLLYRSVIRLHHTTLSVYV